MTTDITDLTTPCAVCGAVPAPHTHHIEPRGRRPDLRDLKEHPENAAPACADCNMNWLIPSGPWRVDRVGEMWVTCDATTGEEVCRRPAENRGSQALEVIHRVGELLDYRGDKAGLLALLQYLPDDDLVRVDEWAGRIEGSCARTRALSRYEYWQRCPWKEQPSWAERIGKLFGVKENTVFQDVGAARLYAEDTGPPKDWSWYREGYRLTKRLGAEGVLTAMNEVWEQGGSVRDFRREMGVKEESEMCDCPTCGNKHVRNYFIGGTGRVRRAEA